MASLRHGEKNPVPAREANSVMASEARPSICEAHSDGLPRCARRD